MTTIQQLSTMTMLEIMEKINKQDEVIKMLNKNATNDRETIKIYISENEELDDQVDKLTSKMDRLTKPKRRQITARKNDLQEWLKATEDILTSVISTNYSNSDEDQINTMFDVADGRYNKKLRPKFRGLRQTKYITKLDSDSEY